jgi:hypothetical protein
MELAMTKLSCALILGLSAVAFADGPATQPAKPMTPDQMLSKMLKPAATQAQPLPSPNTPPATDATSGRGATAPGAPAVKLRREGSFLVDEVGRLSRSADGQQMEFVFETDGKAMKDPPVVILPSLKLMAMESAVKGASRDLKFRISGMVTEYNGRNYVLLEKVVVVPDAVQQF